MTQLLTTILPVAITVVAGLIAWRAWQYSAQAGRSGPVSTAKTIATTGGMFFLIIVMVPSMLIWGSNRITAVLTANPTVQSAAQMTGYATQLVDGLAAQVSTDVQGVQVPAVQLPALQNVPSISGAPQVQPMSIQMPTLNTMSSGNGGIQQFVQSAIAGGSGGQAAQVSAPAAAGANLMDAVNEGVNLAATADAQRIAEWEAQTAAAKATAEANIAQASANATAQAKQSGPVQMLEFGGNGQIVTGKEDQRTGPVQSLQFGNNGQLAVQPAATPTPHTYLYMVDGELVTGPVATAMAQQKQSAAAQAAALAQQQLQQANYAAAAQATARAVDSEPVSALSFDSSGQIAQPAGTPTPHAMLYMVDGNLVYAPEATAIAEQKSKPGPAPQLAAAGQ